MQTMRKLSECIDHGSWEITRKIGKKIIFMSKSVKNVQRMSNCTVEGTWKNLQICVKNAVLWRLLVWTICALFSSVLRGPKMSLSSSRDSYGMVKFPSVFARQLSSGIPLIFSMFSPSLCHFPEWCQPINSIFYCPYCPQKPAN